jgi:glycine betaine/proline transport system ATP-binding protein
MSTDTVIEISNVWKIFGDNAAEALKAVRERGLGKAEVLSEFGAVVGVADVSLSVNRGEIFCIMGCQGLGNPRWCGTLIVCWNRLMVRLKLKARM